MSKITIEIKRLRETNFPFDKVLGDYPIWDESYRKELNRKILDHYNDYQIGVEAPDWWGRNIKTKMHEIMPYYNELYKTTLLEFNPLHNIDYTETVDTDTAGQVLGTSKASNNTSSNQSGTNSNLNETSGLSKTTQEQSESGTSDTTTVDDHLNTVDVINSGTSSGTSETIDSSTTEGSTGGTSKVTGNNSSLTTNDQTNTKGEQLDEHVQNTNPHGVIDVASLNGGDHSTGVNFDKFGERIDTVVGSTETTGSTGSDTITSGTSSNTTGGTSTTTTSGETSGTSKTTDTGKRNGSSITNTSGEGSGEINTTTSGSSKDTGSSTLNTTGEGQTEGETKQDSTGESYMLRMVKGYNGKDPIDAIARLRLNLINIDMMIIKELRSQFMLVF